MQKLFLSILFFFWYVVSFSQTVSGRIVDSISGEPLPGANIFDTISKHQCASNTKGFFFLRVQKDANLRFSFVGYKSYTVPLNNISDTILTIRLQTENTTLQEVSVQGKVSTSTAQSLTYLNQAKITQIPSMLGESDVVKMLATTAGVKQVEGQQGYNVRGSSQDQNLILYDEAIIYNCSHLLGMYSVFNTNAVQIGRAHV